MEAMEERLLQILSQNKKSDIYFLFKNTNHTSAST